VSIYRAMRQLRRHFGGVAGYREPRIVREGDGRNGVPRHLIESAGYIALIHDALGVSSLSIISEVAADLVEDGQKKDLVTSVMREVGGAALVAERALALQKTGAKYIPKVYLEALKVDKLRKYAEARLRGDDGLEEAQVYLRQLYDEYRHNDQTRGNIYEAACGANIDPAGAINNELREREEQKRGGKSSGKSGAAQGSSGGSKKHQRRQVISSGGSDGKDGGEQEDKQIGEPGYAKPLKQLMAGANIRANSFAKQVFQLSKRMIRALNEEINAPRDVIKPTVVGRRLARRVIENGGSIAGIVYPFRDIRTQIEKRPRIVTFVDGSGSMYEKIDPENDLRALHYALATHIALGAIAQDIVMYFHADGIWLKGVGEIDNLHRVDGVEAAMQFVKDYRDSGMSEGRLPKTVPDADIYVFLTDLHWTINTEREIREMAFQLKAAGKPVIVAKAGDLENVAYEIASSPSMVVREDTVMRNYAYKLMKALREAGSMMTVEV